MKIQYENGTSADYNEARLLNSLSDRCVTEEEQRLVQKFVPTVKNLLPSSITLDDFNDLLARTLASKSIEDHFYDALGVYVITKALQKKTFPTFSECVTNAYHHTYNGKHIPLVAENVYRVVEKHADTLNEVIVPDRDYMLTFFAYQTLKRAYLMRSNDGTLYESPQYMWLRVAVGIHTSKDGVLDLESCIDTYESMSNLEYVHATPTLYNAGTPLPQCSSCFLLKMQEDSIEGIFNTLKQCAVISKYAGGIGLSIHNVRSKSSYIAGTNGFSNGIVPMLRVFNNTARYVDQGGGKRRGSIAVYLSFWHADIMDFLEMKLVSGKEEARARDLFYSAWVSDLFMERLEKGEDWSLFCPNDVPGLTDCWGSDFNALYEQYEKEGRARRTINTRTIWTAMMRSQIETGVPYVVYKDAANRCSNQQNLGCINSSNLCSEIIEYTSKDEIAVCNLASVSLPRFVRGDQFDHDKLFHTIKRMTRNLNRVIDINFYPLKEAENSNFRHRPIGLGVQGLSDCLAKLKIPFASEAAIKLDTDIFETIYYAALTASCDEAERFGSYSSFPGSPTSKGLLQFDLWDKTEEVYATGRYGRDKWEALKQRVKKGLRNSLLVAPMPTASTSQILGNHCESFSPLNSVLYQKRTLSGDFVLCMPEFIKTMKERGLWTVRMRTMVEAHRGMVKDIPGIPQDVKDVFQSCWTMKQKWVLDHAISRGKFIDQSQSLNVFMKVPNEKTLSSMLYYGWKHNLKTCLYYLRSQSKAKVIQFGLGDKNGEEEDEGCVTCSA